MHYWAGIGHALDSKGEQEGQFTEEDPDFERRQRIGLIYGICSFLVYVAEVDGDFDDDESDLLEAICSELDHDLNTNLKTRGRNDLLNLAMDEQATAIPSLLEVASQDSSLRHLLLRFGWRMAAKDGEVTADEVNALFKLDLMTVLVSALRRVLRYLFVVEACVCPLWV